MGDEMSGALARPLQSPSRTSGSPHIDGDASPDASTALSIPAVVDEPSFSTSEDSDGNDEFSTPVQGAVTEEAPSSPSPGAIATIGWAFGIKHDPPRGSGKKVPLHLFDLPVEVLQVIVREIGSTNDLTALALTHSALHAIVVPQLYSRFDIVWPDPTEEDELSTGVDALAYGLGTLAMSGNILGPKALQASTCEQCGHVQLPKSDSRLGARISRRVIDNYAQFTRKFSLGNGPPKFVQSYYISTESGKMLGTLVALALYRMVNLESFVWDMPTGIVREVWEALSSLGHNTASLENSSKLESVWVRCPSSYDARTPSQNLHLFLPTENLGARKELLEPSFRNIEHPCFSILPSLRSITVLEIDELAYLEELSVLLATSRRRLRKLRIGISKVSVLFSAQPPSTGNENTFHGESSLTPLGANGVLGVLMSKIRPCYRRKVVVLDTSHSSQGSGGAAPSNATPASTLADEADRSTPNASTGSVNEILNTPQSGYDIANPVSHSDTHGHDTGDPFIDRNQQVPLQNPITPFKRIVLDTSKYQEAHVTETPSKTSETADRAQDRLQLQVLALENVVLSVNVLLDTLDWTKLTDLTLLACKFDEDLWKAFTKAAPSRSKSSVQTSTSLTSTSPNYPIRLRKIHTDGVSTALMTFIKDTLAPNTLESLFLQDRNGYRPGTKVTIDNICKSALRRHRESLQKLSIDSSFKIDPVIGAWKKWALNRDVLAFVTSGKMANLKELAISVDHKDWHFLLQNLPGLPNLRSLYIPNISDTLTGRPDPHELALQILDIITLRPEIELCYIGVLGKCFEILESNESEGGSSDSTPASNQPGLSVWNNPPFLNHEESDDSSVSSDDDDDDGEDGDDDSEDTESTTSESSTRSSANSEAAAREPDLRLREILFFTERVEIFKIRHGTIS